MTQGAKFAWKDSALSLFGSDEEKQITKEIAAKSTAWRNAGKNLGTTIYRINRHKLEKWPEEDYGKFFNGDSYVVLNTSKQAGSNDFRFDIHFWIGKYTSNHDYERAAFKAIELDILMDNKPILHREVQGEESNLLKSYFDFFTIMKGNCDTSFRRCGPDAYKMRLFQIVGERKQISVFQIPFKRGNLNSEDVFVIDCGLRIFQFNGDTANKDEKFKATMYVNKIKRERRGKPRLEILEEKTTSSSHRFYKLLPDGTSKENAELPSNDMEMCKVCDSAGTMDKEVLLSGSVERNLLNSDGVYLVNTAKHLFIWIGKNALPHERKSCMGFAHKYLRDKPNPFIPVTVLSEGQRSKEFDGAF